MSATIKMVFTALLLAGLVTAGCSQEPKSATGHVAKIQLTSAAFADGQPIPVKYTGDALDISPPLAWTNAPAGTKSFALIADDPDAPAGNWTHWVIYDLPPTTTALPEDTLKVAQLHNGAKQGLNISKKTGYNGPRRRPARRTATISNSTRWTSRPASHPARPRRICSRRWTATFSAKAS